MDLNVLQQQLQKATSRGGNGDLFWKPEEGKPTNIRIVPYPADPKTPFRELRFHYKLTPEHSKPIVSPISFGDPDPINDFGRKLMSENDKDQIALGKKLIPRSKYYIPILVRGKETEGVKWYGISNTIFTNIGHFITNLNLGDITDVQTGNDISITYSKAPGDDYGSTHVIVHQTKTPVSTDPNVLAMIKDYPQIEKIFSPPTYDEMINILKARIEYEQSKKTNVAAAPQATAASAQPFEFNGKNGPLQEAPQQPPTVAAAPPAATVPATQSPEAPKPQTEVTNALDAFDDIMKQLQS